MGYRLTRKAADDLRHIYVEGIKLFGAPQAARYHDRLRQAFEMLGQNPQMVRERSEISPPVRVYPCGSHVIVYILDHSGEVLILRVRHGREDWQAEP